jgi:hypothetical protein
MQVFESHVDIAAAPGLLKAQELAFSLPYEYPFL